MYQKVHCWLRNNKKNKDLGIKEVLVRIRRCTKTYNQFSSIRALNPINDTYLHLNKTTLLSAMIDQKAWSLPIKLLISHSYVRKLVVWDQHTKTIINSWRTTTNLTTPKFFTARDSFLQSYSLSARATQIKLPQCLINQTYFKTYVRFLTRTVMSR